MPQLSKLAVVLISFMIGFRQGKGQKQTVSSLPMTCKSNTIISKILLCIKRTIFVCRGRKRKPRRRRPPSSSVATDEERVPHLKSYRKLESPKTTSSTSTRVGTAIISIYTVNKLSDSRVTPVFQFFFFCLHQAKIDVVYLNAIWFENW